MQSVQIVIRHGDRTPIAVVKNNEYVSWQCNAPNEYVSVGEPNSDLTYLEFIDTEANYDLINPFIEKTLWKGSCVYIIFFFYNIFNNKIKIKYI